MLCPQFVPIGFDLLRPTQPVCTPIGLHPHFNTNVLPLLKGKTKYFTSYGKYKLTLVLLVESSKKLFIINSFLFHFLHYERVCPGFVQQTSLKDIAVNNIWNFVAHAVSCALFVRY